jgi:hypothetical protein
MVGCLFTKTASDQWLQSQTRSLENSDRAHPDIRKKPETDTVQEMHNRIVAAANLNAKE